MSASGVTVKTYGSESSRKSALIKEILQLELKFQGINKEKEAHLYRRSERNEYNELNQLEKKLHTDFVNLRSKVKQQLAKLHLMVRKFRGEMQAVKPPSPEFVEKLKVIMEDIEESIVSFKDDQRDVFEELLTDERVHTQEVTAIDKRIEAWSLMKNEDFQQPKSQSVPLSSARDIVKDLPPEVAAFETFLRQTGGPRGGWDEYDHSTFLKWRVRAQGKSSFLREAISHLPTKTAEEVREHEEWYQELLRLQEDKKEAIHQWKLDREAKKETAKEENNLEDEEESERNRKAAQEEIDNADRQRRLAGLNAWKVQKELERAEAEEKKVRATLKLKEKEKEEQEKKREAKRKVEEYQQKRHEQELVHRAREEDAQRQAWEEKRERLVVNAQRISDRNEVLIQERIQRKKQAEQTKQEKEKRLEKLKGQVTVSVDRDPSRLLQPTAGWKERVKQGKSDDGGRVYQLQRRAVPSWRQGL